MYWRIYIHLEFLNSAFQSVVEKNILYMSQLALVNLWTCLNQNTATWKAGNTVQVILIGCFWKPQVLTNVLSLSYTCVALDTVPLSLLVDPSAACLILREYDQMLHTWNFAVQSTLPVHPLSEVKKKYNVSKLKIIS